jgi:Arginine deiminase
MSTQKSVVILDAGNSVIKSKIARRERGEIDFPHALKPLTETEYENILSRSKTSGLSPDYLRINGQPFVVGESAEHHGVHTSRTGSARYTRDYYGIFAAAVVGRLYNRGRESLNMLTIYCYHPMFKATEFDFWYPEQSRDGRFNIQDFGQASLEGGDVQPIGHGTVAIGMSERTQARMIELVAKSLFEKGGAERVIAAVMTKDRAHMHLDTVFTLLDRDIATAFPKVVDNIRAISLRPGKKPGDFHVTEEKSFLDAVADALHVKKLTMV